MNIWSIALLPPDGSTKPTPSAGNTREKINRRYSVIWLIDDLWLDHVEPPQLLYERLAAEMSQISKDNKDFWGIITLSTAVYLRESGPLDQYFMCVHCTVHYMQDSVIEKPLCVPELKECHMKLSPSVFRCKIIH